jgi:hypothetical protein
MTGRVAATLAVLASIATILTFLLTVGQSSSTTSQHLQNPASPVSSASPVGSAGPAAPVNTTGSMNPANGKSSFVSACEQETGMSVSHCQCDLSWLEANDPNASSSSYWTVVAADPQTFVNDAEENANCPP